MCKHIQTIKRCTWFLYEELKKKYVGFIRNTSNELDDETKKRFFFLFPHTREEKKKKLFALENEVNNETLY